MTNDQVAASGKQHMDLGLKDRVEALGGRILLDSPPDAGTTLRLELPLTDANDGGTFQ